MSALSRCGLRSLPHTHLLVARPDPSSRGFSSTVRRGMDLEDCIVSVPSAVLNVVHASGVIPWYVAIPTTAILVRGVFGYLVHTRPAWKRHIRRQVVMPLVQAKTITDRLNRERALAFHAGSVTTGSPPQPSFWRDQWERMIRTHRMGKPLGAPLFYPTIALNFLTLISFMDAIRRMCGSTGMGLLSLLLTPFQWIGINVRDPAAMSSHAHETAAALSQARHIPSTSIDTSELSGDFVNLPAMAENAYFAATLQTEGLAWCTNLCVPDPYYVLPSLLFFSFTATSILRPETEPRRPRRGIEAPLFDLSMPQKSAIIFGLFISYGATALPAGVLLYWIPSILVGWLQARWLHVKYPYPSPITPCTRPLRTRVDTKWIRPRSGI